MIPLTALPWRAIGIGLAVAAVVGSVWFGIHTLGEWRDAYHRLPVVVEKLEQERLCAPESACAKRAATLAAEAERVALEAAESAVAAAAEREQKARADAAAWRAKYKEALTNDPGCAEWASATIRCPL